MAKKATKKEHKNAKRSHNKKIHKALDSENNVEDLNSQLKKLNLCTKDITGDGNCLFRALSDQYYGRDSKHKVIRQEICRYLKENEEIYKFFVEDDQSFDSHLNNMQQDGTFGGNMELAAFAKLYKVDIKVYQPGLIYVIKGVDEGEEEEEDEEEPRQVLHIAYHDWEHYSSVRNVDGPFTGPPEIKEERVQKEEQDDEGKEEDVLDSKEKVILNACPDVSIYMIRRMLKKYKGDTDKVIDRFYELRVTEKDKDIHLKERLEIDNDGNVEHLPLPEQGEEKGEEKDEEKDTEEKDKEEIEKDKERDKETTEKEKPKKMSASERKKEAKRRQKEAKLMKERAKAARRAQREKEEEKSTNEPQTMKELCI
ncbi:hypothetical protein G6F70_003650 [Rhizopus microsporus]|uniref:OTU-domain-containing protein n=1 Tax=Rhizopus microsporus TaxID=58291 RepID=A0A1X0RLU4_RHIZD|nr:hypothetical protein G6F71_003631 [Rhizopus microsporus]KAG1200900.1 hypothetical protein G6F70_003650 [Rhizopus microsporus]KAG1212774.1 hypothetical protein G6F69_003418 [Rhizopus microsporus]ORE12944.1 OTU-domain-containing protein [Rhizopus microsporus]